MSLREFLNQDVSDLFSRRSGDGTPAESAASPQVHLDITRSAFKLEFLCSQPRMGFFSLDAHLAGVLSVSRSMSEDKMPTTRVEIPLDVGGRKFTAVLLYCTEDADRTWPLVEANTVAAADGSRSLRFVFGDEKERTLYKFILPSDIEVADFQPLEREQQSVYTPPTVAQLGAVLRTTLKERRDATSALVDLAQALSAQTVEQATWLQKNLPARTSLTTPAMTLLVEMLNDAVAAGKRAPNAPLVAALCLLLDVEAGVVRSGDLEAFSQGRSALPGSLTALSVVSTSYGLQVEESELGDRLRAAAGEGSVAAVSVSALTMVDDTARGKMRAAMQAIVERMARPRDSLTVLRNLVRESPSPRVDAMVKLWSARSAAVPGTIEGLQALGDLAAAYGKRMDSGTLTAFCLYAEIESCCLGEERFLSWVDGRQTLVLSPYTMQVVATALDVALIGFSLSATQRLRNTFFDALFGLSPNAVMQGLETTDGTATSYRLLRTPADSRVEVEGWRPSGDVMLKSAMLERQTERELNLFLRLGNTFYACFQSDLDRRRVWKLLTPAALREENPFTFIDGFRVFHFQGSVLADLREVTPDTPPAPEGSVSPLVCKDHRNSINFFHPDEPPAAGGVMRDAGMAVYFPPTALLPPIMSEMGPEKLFGRVEAGAVDVRKLELLRHGLHSVVSTREEMGPSLNPRGLSHLRQKLATPRAQQTLRQVVDQRTLEFMINNYMNADALTLELHIFEPVIKGLRDDDLVEFAALALVYELCQSDLTTSRTFHKNFNGYMFRAALRNQLLHIFENESALTKAIGCRLLSTAPCMGDTAERSIIEYELLRRLEDVDDAIAQEAATALARIALEDEMGLPAIWQFRKVETAAGGTNSTMRAQMLLNVAHDIRNWQTRLSSMMAGASFNSAQSATPPLRPGTAPAAPVGGLRDLSSLLLGLRLAVSEPAASPGTGPAANNGSGDRTPILPQDLRGRIILTDAPTLDSILRNLVDSFAAYADACRLPLAGAAQEISGRGLAGYLAYLAREGDAGRGERLALGASADTPDLDASVDSFLWDSVCLPQPFWIETEEKSRPRISAFFMALVRRAMECPVETIRVCVLPSSRAGDNRRAPGRSADGADVVGMRSLPPPFRMLVYDAANGNFVPFVQSMLATAQFSYSLREQELLNAVAAALARLMTAEREAVASAVAEVAQAAVDSAMPHPVVIEQEKPEVLKRARRMLEQFALPPTYLPQILYVFQEIRPISVYEFF